MSADVIDVECPGCSKRYRVKAAMAGKKFQCKACEAVIAIPAPKATSRPAAKPSPTAAAKRKPAPSKGAAEEDPWDFDSDDDDAAPLPQKSRGKKPTGKGKSSQKKKSRSKSGGGGMPLLGWLAGGGVLFMLLLFVAALAVPALRGPVVILLVLAGGLSLLIGNFGTLVMAFRVSAATGIMVMLIPFYVFVFIFQNLEDTWRFVACSVAGMFLVGLSIPLTVLMEGGGGGVGEAGGGGGGGFGGFNLGGDIAADQNNARQMGFAAHNHHDVTLTLPPGESGMSWQTALLPYLEAQPTYQLYDASVPWSDPKNRAAAESVIPTYLISIYDTQKDGAGYAVSHWAFNRQLITPEGKGMGLRDLTDGTSNTVMFGEVAAGFRPWADPDNTRDMATGFGATANQFGSSRPDGVLVGLCDGSVRQVSTSIDPAVLTALGTPNGGEVIIDF